MNVIRFSTAVAVALLAACSVAGAGGTEPATYSSDFGQPLAAEWKLIGGHWQLDDGCLRQTDPGQDDPTKAVWMLGPHYEQATNVVLTAKLRIDAWMGGDYSRAGVSLASDVTSGHGVNLVFHRGALCFQQDYVAWGASCPFPVEVGHWYWLKLTRAGGQWRGKAWTDGQPEPAEWLVRWDEPEDGVLGYPALVGGSGGPGGELSAVSFARCEVTVAEAAPPDYYLRKPHWHETMIASRLALDQRQMADAAHLQALWRLVRRDFADPAAQRQIAQERQDGIWNVDATLPLLPTVAQRYALATRAGLAPRARQLAQAVRAPADIEPVRDLYYRSHQIEATLARWNPNQVTSLRGAVDDLVQTFADRYPGGPQYLQRIAQSEQAIAAAAGSADKSRDVERLFAAIAAFEALRQEALLANPLLDFDRLLLIDRKDARAYRPLPSFSLPPFAGKDHLLNGLPHNFQGNAVLRQVPIDNRIAVLSPVGPHGNLTTLYRPDRPGYVGELRLHFDADRLLFSGLDAGQRFQIYQIGTSGQNLQQVTRGADDDVDNYDACYLADDRILFGSSACFQSVPCERRYDEVANLFVMNADGSGVRRLCFDQDHDFYPSLLADGRVLYTRWEYTDIAHAFSARLFTMNPDGTRQRAYYGSGGYWPNRIFYARPVPDSSTRFVGIVTGHHGTARAGELVLFDVAAGRRQADGAVQRIPGRGRKVEPVLKDALVDDSWPKFLHPYPLSDKYFLVSCQPTPQSLWGVYLVDVFDNFVLLHEAAERLLLEPVPLRQTPRPPVIPAQTVPEAREAVVWVNDIYRGEGLAGVPRGTVKNLRLFTYHFNYYGTSGIEDYVGMDGPWDVRRILGTVPVAEDGSAYFTVPANTPIALQPLDAEGKALQLMRSWFTAMPGEVVSCVGCHEYGNSSPTERPLAALGRAPAAIEPWHGAARGFGWDREVQPVIDKYCVGCHDGGPRPGGEPLVDLRRAEPRRLPLSDAPFPPAFYELRRFVRSPGLEGDPQVLRPAEYHADTTPLVQMLRKGHHNVRLDEEAWDRLITWLDLNAPAYGTWSEVPGVAGNAAVQLCRARRIESHRHYGGSNVDPEAASALPATIAIPVVPPPSPPDAPVRLDGWPLSAADAKARQSSATDRTEWEVDLGAGVTMRFVLVPAGEFVMGEPGGYADERPAGAVTIDRPFWLGQCEVTNEEFARFDPTHDSGRESMLWLKWDWEDYLDLAGPKQPVCRVSWQQAQAFCRWLAQRTGREFSLPTEAQWEWACRAGTDTATSFGPAGADFSPYANLADAALLNLAGWNRVQTPFGKVERVRPFYAAEPVDDRFQVSSPVGSYRPNAWGLYDMHGNVGEWTASAYVPYPFADDDPRHADANVRRVVRGGSWYVRADLARSACRTSYWPWQRVFDVGFRVACPVQ